MIEACTRLLVVKVVGLYKVFPELKPSSWGRCREGRNQRCTNPDEERSSFAERIESSLAKPTTSKLRVLRVSDWGCYLDPKSITSETQHLG